MEFNQTGDLLATGDKGGRVVIFQRETEVGLTCWNNNPLLNPECPQTAQSYYRCPFCVSICTVGVLSIFTYKCLWLCFSSLFSLDSLKGSQRRWGRRGTLGSTMSTARSRVMSRTLTTWRAWRLKRKSTRSDGCHSRMQHISSSPPMVRNQWHQEINQVSNSQLGWGIISRPVYSLCYIKSEISSVKMHDFDWYSKYRVNHKLQYNLPPTLSIKPAWLHLLLPEWHNITSSLSLESQLWAHQRASVKTTESNLCFDFYSCHETLKHMRGIIFWRNVAEFTKEFSSF